MEGCRLGHGDSQPRLGTAGGMATCCLNSGTAMGCPPFASLPDQLFLRFWCFGDFLSWSAPVGEIVAFGELDG